MLIQPCSLTALREAHDITREELALGLNCTVRAVYAYESRDRMMSAAVVVAASRVLGLGEAEELGLHRWAAVGDGV